MVNNKAYKVAKYAIVLAIIFVAMMIDRAISLIPVGFSMAGCVLLVTLSFCFLENEWKMGIISGTFFGIASFLKEFLMPSALVGQVFKPYYWLLITIPPRALMGVVAFSVYRLMLTVTRSMGNARGRQILCLTVASFFGLVTNTVGFFSFLELSRTIANVNNDGVFALIYAALLTNILPEYLISLIGVSAVVLGVRRGLKLGIDGNNLKRETQSKEL